ncbi:esterase/lipase family protein [Jatrophihabitans sp. YIM 134969]
MRPVEVFDAGRLTGRTLADVGRIARGVHRATSDRVFDALGPVAAPVRVLHDGISAVAYGATSVGLTAVPALAGVVGAGVQAARGGGTPAYDSPGGRFTLSAVSGILGDTIEQDHRSLAPPLALRTEDGPLRRDPAALGPDLTAATGRVVVFVHGLCESDMSWRMGAAKQWDDPSTTYGSLLAGVGWTPLYLTYNTGRHVSDNGRDIADLFESVVTGWPVPVTEIALVGHSMGGLVLRSAVAQASGQAWLESLRHMVFLGSPHLGAPLERTVHRASTALARTPQTAPFADFLRRRSVGVKDLRHGALVAADWEGVDLDADLPDRCTVVPFPDDVAVHALGVTLAARPDSAFGRLAGDLLVTFDSAGSRGHATRRLPSDDTLHFGGLHHFHLLNHPWVYDALRAWLR